VVVGVAFAGVGALFMLFFGVGSGSKKKKTSSRRHSVASPRKVESSYSAMNLSGTSLNVELDEQAG